MPFRNEAKGTIARKTKAANEAWRPQMLVYHQLCKGTGRLSTREPCHLREVKLRDQDCTQVLCNLEIGTQFQDSENAQPNLEIAQIPKLRGTYRRLIAHYLCIVHASESLIFST